MKTVIWKNLTDTERKCILQRPVMGISDSIDITTRNIIGKVKTEGDSALREFTKQFDRVEIGEFRVSASEIKKARDSLPKKVVSAMERAIKNLEKFHAAQLTTDIKVETSPGIICEIQSRPIQRVGLYVPGGTAPLPSTVLMLGVASKTADNPQRILCTPPREDGTVSPAILVAASLCGIDTIYKLGGAQAIAAMAYGTESISPVDKIFGPGNAFVTCAKQIVSLDPTGAGMDMPAGPSEVMVFADNEADPQFVAADLLSQAEHGVDSQSLLICFRKTFAKKVVACIQEQLKSLSRSEIAREALKNSAVIIVDDLKEAIAIVNTYAPEHLIIQTSSPSVIVKKIQCAGSIFIGQWTPESVGDYASGTNHVLPTYGYARYCSGLSVSDFRVKLSVQSLTRAGLESIGDTVTTLAELEGLDGHSFAVKIRLEGGKRND